MDIIIIIAQETYFLKSINIILYGRIIRYFAATETFQEVPLTILKI